MAGILARKLGMTQIFGEDGAVARVTVLEAGPCHVTALRTTERDGYDAVQLAFGAGWWMSIRRLWVRISKCSRESLSLNGERITQ